MLSDIQSQVNSNQAVALSESAYWIGAFDPDLRTFDVILSTANGTSYNSYLVRGSDGVAIIDTVKEEFSDTFFARLESIVDYSEIKVIVLNHLEPDHSGALPELMKRAPQAQLYISKKAQLMLKGLLKQDELNYTPVLTGDEVSLGDRTLRFLHTPFLHWPDTQCTYLVEEKTLFSGDVFGCHFCDTRLFNDLTGDFRFSFEYYYSHIMRPFKEYVIDALQLIEPLHPTLIAPTHGPILRDRPMRYVYRYKELSLPSLTTDKQVNEKTLLIFYISSYGNTRKMAEFVYQGMIKVPGVRVSMYDLQSSDVQPFVDLIEDADAVVFGSPTINGDAVKPIWDLLSSLVVINMTGKLGAVFGSYGWTGEAVELIEDRLRGLKLRIPIKGVRIKLIPTDEELDECLQFGLQVAQELMGKRKTKKLDFADLI